MSRLKLQDSTVYFGNKFVPFSRANISIASSPVLYGLCIYTVFSVSWNNKQKKLYAFRLNDHFDRLVNSAKIMDFHGFVDEWTYDRFEDDMLALLKKNKVQEDALVRATVFVDELVAGTKIHGLKNSFCAYVYPMGEILPRTGISACVSSWQRTADNAIPSRAKVNGSYINASLMKNEALLNGYDEAIAVDDRGHVTEGTVANLFIVRGGKLITPDAATDILEGITRSSVLEIADLHDIEHIQRSVDRSELYLADEAFMCGSSARITPILSIDKRPVNDGKIGPITAKMMKYYEQVQRGSVKEFAHWRTTVKL